MYFGNFCADVLSYFHPDEHENGYLDTEPNRKEKCRRGKKLNVAQLIKCSSVAARSWS
jgi:hypothetical protein